MILGMSTASFTLFHVILSLIGIAAGIVVLFGMLAGRRLDGWTALFLATTVLTSVTGFMFHSAHFGPPHGTPAMRSTKNRPAANSAAPSITHTGKVSTHARMILRTVSFCSRNRSRPWCRRYPRTARGWC
jgi:hypothetical protein